MPLIKVTLRTGIWAITEPRMFGKEYPRNKLELVVRWSDVIETYASTIFPLSAPQTPAIGSFRGTFILHTLEAQDYFVRLSAAVHSYAAALVPGMLVSGFVAVPPPVPPDFTPLMTLGYGYTAEQIADFMANTIDTYFRTGTATPQSGGPVINWN